jgi:hypothetical protein
MNVMPAPDPDATPTERMRASKNGLRQVLTVSRSELATREKQYQHERATKLKPGPQTAIFGFGG